MATSSTEITERSSSAASALAPLPSLIATPPACDASYSRRAEGSQDHPHGKCALTRTTTMPRNRSVGIDRRAVSRILKSCLSKKQIPRSHQRQQLIQALEDQSSANATRMVVISGPSGAGKTSLVPTTLAAADRQRKNHQNVLVLQGRFDWLGRGRCEPYQALVAAVTEYTYAALQKEKEHVASLRARLLAALGPNVPVLTSIIPALQLLLCPAGDDDDGDKNNHCDPTNMTASSSDKSPRSSYSSTSSSSSSSSTKGDDVRQRFVFSLKTFLQCICQEHEHQVVLVLDDLQYADPSSLDIISLLATDSSIMQRLLLVGVCDDSAVSKTDYLSQKLRDMEKNSVRITSIVLDYLQEGEISEVLEDALQMHSLDASVLAKLVFQRTNGNLFYLFDLLEWLVEHDILYMTAYDSSSSKWCLDREEMLYIQATSINDFLSQKLVQLSGEIKVLQTLACLGSSVQKDHLCHVVGDLEQQHLLEKALAIGVLEYDDSAKRYAFVHTSVQRAVYELIPDADKESFHLQVSRRLWKGLDWHQVDLHVFTILSNMMIGRRLITNEKEREAVAKLCLLAGGKAAKSSSFQTASIYLGFGIALLQDDKRRCWRVNYDLTLALYNAAAEMELCNAEYEKCFSTLQEVFDNARCFEDKVPAYRTRIYVLSVDYRQQEAIDLGLEVLEKLGEPLPRRLNRLTLIRESRIVQRLLKGKSDEQILRLPTMEKGRKLMAMQVLQLISWPSQLARPQLAPFVILRMVRLSLKHGLCVFSSMAFSAFGMLHVAKLNEPKTAFRYGSLGLELLEKFGAIEYLPRVYTTFYTTIWHWSKPLGEASPALEKAHLVGMQLGDSEAAAMAANFLCFHAFYADSPLTELLQRWDDVQQLMVSNRNQSLLRNALPTIQAIHHFVGLSCDPLDPKGDLIDYNEVFDESLAVGGSTLALVCQYSQMIVKYVFNSVDSAAEHADYVAQHFTKEIPPTFSHVVAPFFAALSKLRSSRGKLRSTLSYAKAVIKQFQELVKTSPHNACDKLYLLQAELASVCGQNETAYEKYLCAIAVADKERSQMFLALAYERFARHLLIIDASACAARPYFQQALLTYTEWKAKAKVERLSAELQKLYPSNNFD